MTRVREQRAIARAVAFTIRLYQVVLSPLLGPSCRFQPTCSEYARDAVLKHGALRGVALAARRIGRCHPWNEGGFDPVPDDDPETHTHRLSP